MSDQWGQPQQPQQPQSPYGQPGNPYDQPTNVYGQQPNPYGQPGNPYAQPGNPYGQPQGQIPGQPGYGFPPPAPPQKSKKGLIIGGVAAAVVVVIAVVAVNMSGGSTSGSATTAQTCAGFQTEENTANNQDPSSEAETIQVGQQSEQQVTNLANNAQAGTLNNELHKYASDINTTVAYMQAHPNIDVSGDSAPPAQLMTDGEAISADETAIYATCGLTDPDSDDGDGSGSVDGA